MAHETGSELSRFLKELMSFQKRALDRFPQYLNTHYSDATFEQRTLYEMMSKRLAKIEEVMKPAPEHVKDEEADALEHKSPRLY
jgi:hypothetical protein